MKRLGVMAVVAAVALTGCGGGGDKAGDAKTPEATPSLALLSASQACAQVQLVNEELDGPGKWPIPTYGKFGEETAPLAGESVPEIASALREMSDQALAVGAMSGGDGDVTAAAGEWATRYQMVADICARTDSPIGRLP